LRHNTAFRLAHVVTLLFLTSQHLHRFLLVGLFVGAIHDSWHGGFV
jgi:hypothetical protein